MTIVSNHYFCVKIEFPTAGPYLIPRFCGLIIAAETAHGIENGGKGAPVSCRIASSDKQRVTAHSTTDIRNGVLSRAVKTAVFGRHGDGRTVAPRRHIDIDLSARDILAAIELFRFQKLPFVPPSRQV